VRHTKVRLLCLVRVVVALLLIFLPLEAARADDEATVVKVVDGDTLDVLVEGRKKRVRLIGIDTSELHESDKLIRDASRSECSASDLQGLGADAARFVQRVLSPGDAIRLEYGQQRQDDYERTLAFVWLSDGRLLNELLVCEGYAQARLHYVTRADYRTRFQQCSRQAQAANKGLWSAGCWTRTRGAQPTTPRSPSAEGDVRGNRKSRIYHLPKCPHYNRMHAANIVGFATEADARAAGYRKAKNCPD
jgi:micrococcal nuclease